MDVEVFLGDAFRFVVFDKYLNKFNVKGNLVKPEDVGDYPIQVTAKFFNATFQETFRKSFILTVWDDTVPEEVKPWFPPDPIYYPEWK